MESAGLERPQIEGGNTLDVDIASKYNLFCNGWNDHILIFVALTFNSRYKYSPALLGLLTSKSDDHWRNPKETERLDKIKSKLQSNTDRNNSPASRPSYNSPSFDIVQRILKRKIHNYVSKESDFLHLFEEEEMKWMGKREQMFYRFRRIQKMHESESSKRKVENQKSWINMSSINLPSVENSSVLKNTKDTDNHAGKSKVTVKHKQDSLTMSGLYKKPHEAK